MPQARGGAGTSLLKPSSRSEAPTRSLSAIYGFGAQPLHTDGAHLPVPPDLVVLHAAAPNSTSTVVWRIPEHSAADLDHGVFVVHGGSSSFLAHARAGDRLRFDPGCMKAADHVARRVATYFEEARTAAHVHRWMKADTVLFIDNRGALHARDAVADGDRARVLTRLTFRRRVR